jgi:subtilisin family serine protease
MTKLVILLIFLFSFNSLAQDKVKVAIIDTGLDLKYANQANLCRGEHKDLTGEGLSDIHGHGTNITGLIVKGVDSSKYCIVIIKAYAFKGQKTRPKGYITEALKYAYKINANIINLSGGGFYPIAEEKQIVKKILDAKITLVVAAGNNNENLTFNCIYYPACYDSRIYVIGNIQNDTNYGKIVDTYYDGVNKTGFGITLTGTSQSTAIFTNKLLKLLDLNSKAR